MTRHDTARSSGEHTGGLQFVTLAFFVVLLAGQFGFERIGMENPFGLPERLVGLLLVLFFAIVLGSSARQPDGGVRLLVLLSLPTIFALTSALWGPPAVPDADETVVDLIAILLAMVIAAILLSWNARVFCISFLRGMALAGLTFSLAGLAGAVAGGRVAAFGGGPNVFSRVTMLGLVAIIGLVLLKKLPPVVLLVSPLIIIATISSGSRGGMLAGLVALMALLPLLRNVSLGRRIVGSVVLLTCGVAVYLRYSDIVNASIGGRVVDLTLRQGYSSGRGDLASAALDLFRDNFLFGAGLRAFADYYGQGFTYPHNLVLHIMSESGLVGLTLLLAALAAAAVAVLRRYTDTLVVVFGASAALVFVASMFSGDYYDARFMWIFLLVAVNAPRSGSAPRERYPSADVRLDRNTT